MYNVMTEAKFEHQSWGCAIRITGGGLPIEKGGRGAFAVMQYQIQRRNEKMRRLMERQMTKALFAKLCA